jgi:hypothetical protein
VDLLPDGATSKTLPRTSSGNNVAQLSHLYSQTRSAGGIPHVPSAPNMAFAGGTKLRIREDQVERIHHILELNNRVCFILF